MPQITWVISVWTPLTVRVHTLGKIQTNSQRKWVFLQNPIRSSKQSGWWELNCTPPFNSCPIEACWFTRPSLISTSSTPASGKATTGISLAFFLPPLWRNHSATTGHKCFLLGCGECQKKQHQRQLRNTHAETIRGGIQKASELYFSRRTLRRILIFWATRPSPPPGPPARPNWRGMHPFHEMNRGHAWHRNDGRRSRRFPHSWAEGGRGWRGGWMEAAWIVKHSFSWRGKNQC